MSQVVTFEDYFPPPRFDSIPWTEVRIEEGAAADGPWAQIDVVALDPLDTDPAHPIERNFTTELASDTPYLWYRVIFADGTGDVSQPSDPVQNKAGIERDYITREALKETLTLTGLSFADEDIESSITAASRAVDDITRRHFWRDNQPSTRTYVQLWSRLLIDDIIQVDEVTVNGSTLAVNTDYVMRPLNAPFDGRPYGEIQFMSLAPYTTTPGVDSPVVSVTGTFGWPSVPQAVVTATTILATRFLRRQREAPFGIVTVGIDTGTAARIMTSDPDVKTALCDYIKPQVMIA